MQASNGGFEEKIKAAVFIS